MITRRGFFGTVAALVVGGGAARLVLTPAPLPALDLSYTPQQTYFLSGPWVLYGGSAGCGKTLHMDEEWRQLTRGLR